jgi:hypothetical protein
MDTTSLVSATCRPIFLPLGQLGEKVAIAFVGVSDSGSAFASQVLTKVLRCLPSDMAHACVSFSEIVVEDYLNWCKRGKSAQGWRLPLAGLEVGDQVAISAYSESDLVAMSRRLASLHVELTEAQQSNEQLPTTPRVKEEKIFLDQVIREVLRSRPQLKNRFHRDFNLRGRSVGNQIDFCGLNYVTCYAAINPKSRSRVRVSSAAAALWNLARVRDAFGFAMPLRIELTTWVPPKGLPTYTDADYALVEDTVSELQEQATREALTVFSVPDSLLAGARLVELEMSSVAMQ